MIILYWMMIKNQYKKLNNKKFNNNNNNNNNNNKNKCKCKQNRAKLNQN